MKPEREKCCGELLHSKSKEMLIEECNETERLCGKNYADCLRLLYGINRENSHFMKFLISTKGLENDPKFKKLLGDYSLAKTALIAYFMGVMQEDLSNTSLKDQLLQTDDWE